ncbi:MAG: molybdopterin-dependent oxidoreductase, partial [Candidatus Bathyarchaeia archaeon]
LIRRTVNDCCGVGRFLRSEVTPIEEFFVLQKGEIPKVDVKRWVLSVDGSVESPLVLTYEDLIRMPQFSEVVTLECFDNVPGGRLIGTALWTGVRVKDVLKWAGVKEDAVKVLFHAADGYSTSHTILYAARDDVILALKMNDVALPQEHGFPLRLVAPGKYGYKWAKWITRIEVVDYDKKGYYEDMGYSDEADRVSPG